MQEHHRARSSFAQSSLPWLVGAVALCFYVVTLSRWVTLDSLPYVAKVAGWDWTLPYQSPLFFLLTYPIRWLPASWEPLALNLFTAVCSALSLALLTRSVALLPHDRTHEQRQRERSEFSLLSIRSAWLPPLFAALVCGLELTFWENSTAATTEALDLLVFAYVIRCLLEFRVDGRESWLTRMAFVFGLGVANNFAMIGFFPCVLVSVFWIKGLRFFEFRFVARMVAFGLLGLSLYLLLPLVWAISDNPTVGFGQALRAHLGSQKAMLLHTPQMRTRVLILSLTSVLPLIIAGIRWPASFGDTSAAGAAFSSFMFRLIHTFFLAACVWVAFDQQFSPRALGFGRVAFLTFYYLGALSIGYFSGYLLLVFGEGRSKSWHRRSGLGLLLGRVVVVAVWIALVAVPAALLAKNWSSIRTTNGPLLREFTRNSADNLPAKGGIVLSDDPYSLLLMSATLSDHGTLKNYALVHTRSLSNSEYHRELHRHYPTLWPNVFTNQAVDELVDDGALVRLLSALSRTNEICYLHPSFGYYFERFYMKPEGLIYKLQAYSTNDIFPPPIESKQRDVNEAFWSKLEPSLTSLAAQAKTDSRNARYLASYYARALNYWGVALQRDSDTSKSPKNLEDAGKHFQLAADLNTNNVPAQSNFEFNRSRRKGERRIVEGAKSIEDKFGAYRGWEPMLVENGPFDQPEFCLRLGQIFAGQGLLRQAAIQFDRVRTLDKTNQMASVALADVLLRAERPKDALAIVEQVRTQQADNLPMEVAVELARVEASAQFTMQNVAAAEKLLRDTFARYPKYPGILDTLLQIYAQTDHLPDALTTSETIIKADPDRVQSYINQAALYLRIHQFTNAVASVDRILQKSPQQPDALLYKIFLLMQGKDYTQAKTAINGLLSVEPENMDAILYRGVVEIETKAYAQAIESMNQVLKQRPNYPDALRNRGFAHLQLGDLAQAEQDYSTMRRLVTRDYVYVAYYGLGEVAYKRGDMATARKFYLLYLQYAPQSDNPQLIEEKKMVTGRLQELKEAKR